MNKTIMYPMPNERLFAVQPVADVEPYRAALARIAELEAMVTIVDALNEVADAAAIIHRVAAGAWNKADAPECPHWFNATYPSPGVWCDDCFDRLGEALEKLDDLRAAAITPPERDMAVTLDELEF